MQLSRAIQLVLLAYCTLLRVKHAQADVTCTAGSFIVGSRGMVHCDFGTDIRRDRHDFNVAWYALNDTNYENRKNLLACNWENNGQLKCFVKAAPGYEFYNSVGSTLTLTIPVVDKSMAGLYRCQLVNKPINPNMHFCNLTVIDPPPATTTKAPTTPKMPTTRPNLLTVHPEVNLAVPVITDNDPASTGTPESPSTPVNSWSTDGTNQTISNNKENEGSDGAPVGLIIGVVIAVVVVAAVVGIIVFWRKYRAKWPETPNGSEQDQDGCFTHILCCRPASSPKKRLSGEPANNDESGKLLSSANTDKTSVDVETMYAVHSQNYQDERSELSVQEKKKLHEIEIQKQTTMLLLQSPMKTEPKQNVQRVPSQPEAHTTQDEVIPDNNSQTDSLNSHRETNDEEVENEADDFSGGLEDEANEDTLMQHDQLPPAPNAQVGSPVSPEPDDSTHPNTSTISTEREGLPLSPNRQLSSEKPQVPPKPRKTQTPNSTTPKTDLTDGSGRG